MRTARRQRGSRWTAAAALLAAAATLIGQGWTTSHDVAVQHVLCVEHGEVMHVAPARAAAGAPSPATAAARPAAAAPAGERAPCEHEHCAVAPALRDGADPPPARAAVSFVPPPPTVSAPR